MKDSYINISKAFSSSLVERTGTSTILNSFVPIKQIAEAKGLKSTRSLRLEINKPESKYISREVKVNGGTSYEILFSSLEPELQQLKYNKIIRLVGTTQFTTVFLKIPFNHITSMQDLVCRNILPAHVLCLSMNNCKNLSYQLSLFDLYI